MLKTERQRPAKIPACAQYQLILKNGLLVAMLNEKGKVIMPKEQIRK